MGDVVLMTPALRALRRGLPEAELVVALDEGFAPLLENHPDVDRVLTLGSGAGSKIAFAARCRRMGFDGVLNFHGGPTSAWLTAASGASLRVGRDNYRFSTLYNLRVSSPETIFAEPEASHTVFRQASLVAALGFPVEDFSLHIPVAEEAPSRVVLQLAALEVPSSGYVVLQPTASFPSKQWPSERFLHVARELKHKARRDVVVILPGSLLDAGRKTKGTGFRPGELAELFHPEFPVLSGMPLEDLVGLMASAGLYFGNDSGPMHLAAAVGTPVVGIFGSSNPRRWHPWGVAHRVLWAGLDCSPCHGKSCVNPEQFACLEKIEVQTALDAALELLGENEPQRR
jgi:ADP-heptose:LPS heptosyltransferase